ncbi:MAG: [FeFe] hydrogenase H-cluster radical SAM maturase HydE [Planctomycetes bacterium]|nr:[FeFe] hydrogenase H-cluster radical SAM maturase HydE [Planctomycetota bacterium]
MAVKTGTTEDVIAGPALQEIVGWLTETDEGRLAHLWRLAEQCRRDSVGDEVHLRGLIEISNYCVRRCGYCGINAGNRGIERYRMTQREILDCARQAVEFGYGTVVLQSGEDPGLKADWIAQIIRAIKKDTPLAVTLSLGERSDEEFVAWRQAGADRYLIRFETSNPQLYEHIHPSLPGRRSDRIAILRQLTELGYEAGSGVMVGIPGQTYLDLARDILTFADLDLDMIGVGPYLPHPATPLGKEYMKMPANSPDQAPNTELMTCKVMALARLVCPLANIPSTTALATVNRESGRELGLMRGANIVMPNLTPAKYRAMYEIYPAKACIQETADKCHECMKARIVAIGRKIGAGRGDSKAKYRRTR